MLSAKNRIRIKNERKGNVGSGTSKAQHEPHLMCKAAVGEMPVNQCAGPIPGLPALGRTAQPCPASTRIPFKPGMGCSASLGDARGRVVPLAGWLWPPSPQVLSLAMTSKCFCLSTLGMPAQVSQGIGSSKDGKLPS